MIQLYWLKIRYLTLIVFINKPNFRFKFNRCWVVGRRGQRCLQAVRVRTGATSPFSSWNLACVLQHCPVSKCNPDEKNYNALFKGLFLRKFQIKSEIMILFFLSFLNRRTILSKCNSSNVYSFSSTRVW